MEAATATAPAAPPRRRPRGMSQRRLAKLMLAPSMILIAIVAAYPIGYAVWLSLNEYSVRVPGLSRWAGLRNYEAAITSSAFWEAMGVTFAFTVISVALELVVGLAMAVAMHSAFRGRALLRTVVLVPWAVLTVVTAVMWRTIFEPNLGFVNNMLGFFGLPGSNTIWLQDAGLPVLVFADVWKTAPFMALLLLAGLQVIPGEIYEAARVDGASAWQRFMRITLPLLKPAILVALIFRTLDALRIFDLPYVLSQAGANNIDTLSVIAYQELQQNRLIGLGSALSVLTFVLVMTVSLLYIRFVGGNIRALTEE